MYSWKSYNRGGDFEGIKSKTIKKDISENLNLKSRSSFNEFSLIDDKQKILSTLKERVIILLK